MINGFNSASYNAILGDGGEEKFKRVSDEIDKTAKETQERLDKAKNKTFADLDPLEQLLLSIDSSLNNAQKMQEGKKYHFFREQQFKQYVKDAYGINI